jgi:Subtilisin-like serine proteases
MNLGQYEYSCYTCKVLVNGQEVGGIYSWSWYENKVSFVMPSNTQSGYMQVKDSKGNLSNQFNFSISIDPSTTHPSISSMSPQAITPGDIITIVGSNFGSSQGNSTIVVDSYIANGTVISWADTQIQYKTSSYWDATSRKIGIKKCNGSYSCQSVVYGGYFYIQPKITSLDYVAGPVGMKVTIYGNYLKDNNVHSDTSASYAVKVYFNGVPALYPANGIWTSSVVEAFVPSGATSGNVTLEISSDTGEKVTVSGPYFTIWEKISNDEYSSLQLYFKQINLPQAWGIASNRRSITVAVIDDGVYSNHPDLKNVMWQNTDEIIGNSKDDDNNGYIDDRYGWDFVNNTSDVTPLGSHGTQVAGIIGAEKDNEEGIAGVNQDVKIMPLIVCASQGCMDYSKAIRYAVDNGAEVINLSLGTVAVSGYTTSVNDAINYAYNHNVLIVTAAGNGDTIGGQGFDLGQIPQSPVCNNDQRGDKVIGVGAVDSQNYRPQWSNYGSCIDIWAPGVDIISTAAPAYSTLGGFYTSASGTSFSAPIVTGIVSLLKATYPTITSEEVAAILVNNSNGGIVDAYKVLSANYTPVNQHIEAPTNQSSNSQNNSGISSDGIVSEEKSLVIKVDKGLAKRLSGSILLQVEKNGEAWYVNPTDQNKYYLQNGSVAYNALRVFGLGITNSDLEKIPVGVESRFLDTDTDGDGLVDKLEEGLKTDPNKNDTDGDGVSDGEEVLKRGTNPLGTGMFSYNNTLINRLKGRILLQVQSKGEAWYINPVDGKRYYMKDGDAAYQIMRFLSLGITNADLRKISVGILGN